MAGIVATLPSIPKTTRMLRRSCIAILLEAIAVEADGLFYRQADNAIAADDVENRPIVSDSGRNRTDPESAKFSFEFKSENF
jgi:hypothetical protein